jgi:hypothetical protein
LKRSWNASAEIFFFLLKAADNKALQIIKCHCLFSNGIR